MPSVMHRRAVWNFLKFYISLSFGVETGQHPYAGDTLMVSDLGKKRRPRRIRVWPPNIDDA